MGLPKINESYSYVKTNLPSGKYIGVRGWKVKDEKELLFALESEENAENNKTKYIISFLKGCVDDPTKFDTVSENDLKKICIEVRKLAKGDTIEYDYKCSKCGLPLHDEVNITKHQAIKNFDESPIKVNDELVITMRDLPFKKSEELFEKYKTRSKFLFYYIVNSIDGITYKGETFTEFSEAEMVEFLDQLDPKDMDEIYKKFDEKVSEVELKRTVKCLKCKTDTEVNFGDLLSFLVL